MAQYKNQHFIPQYYFRNFSKDDNTICLFNLNNERFVQDAPIRGQCSENYFYGQDPSLEMIFSNLESEAQKKIMKIINQGTINSLSDEEKQHLKSHILFQRGRTKLMYEIELDLANRLLDTLKPSIYQEAVESGKDISWEAIEGTKITSKGWNSLAISMLGGLLLFDLNMVLLINKTKADFIFSDNPVILHNSFFNYSINGCTTGYTNTGLQIFYPITSKLMILLYDPSYYIIKRDDIKLNKAKDIHRINGLQILHCDKNLYFENISSKDKIYDRYKQLKNKRPHQKSEMEMVGSRPAGDDTYNPVMRTSTYNIKYNLEKLSFIDFKKNSMFFGIRNQKLNKIFEEICKDYFAGKIKSTQDIKDIFNKYSNSY